MYEKRMKPLHPGEILHEEFLLPMGLSQNKVVLDIRISARRINEIVMVREELLPILHYA